MPENFTTAAVAVWARGWKAIDSSRCVEKDARFVSFFRRGADSAYYYTLDRKRRGRARKSLRGSWEHKLSVGASEFYYAKSRIWF